MRRFRLSRLPLLMALLALMAGCSISVGAQAASATTVGSDVIADSIPHPVAAGQAANLGPEASSQTLRVVLGLREPHPAAEEAFLQALQDRSSPLYHQYLTAAQWNARFAPTAAQQQSVVQWIKSEGLTVTQTYSDRLLIDTEGSVAAYEHAFGVTINNYRSGGKTFYSNADAINVPSAVSSVVESVNGLDDYRNAQSSAQVSGHPVVQPAAPAYSGGPVVAAGPEAAHSATASHATTAHPASNSAPEPLYDGLISPLNLWSSDGYDEGPLYAQGHCCDADGTVGQSSLDSTIAISTAGSFDGNDLATYAQQCCSYVNGTTLAYNYASWYIDGTPTCCNLETTLDVESATAEANSFGSYQTTAKVIVYEGANSGLGTFLDVDNLILSQDSTRIFTTSWGLDETDTGDSTMDSFHSIFNAMAGQGWTMNAAAGDSGSYDNGTSLSVDYPASDPDIVASGGTELHLNSDGTYNYETTWNNAGGGCSNYWATPSYQSGLDTGCSTRAVPDVSLNASNNTAQVLWYDGGTNGDTSELYSVWGTSEVAPELAGIWAVEGSYLLSQGSDCGSSGTGACAPLGDPHGDLYLEAENTDRAPHYPFYDITTGNNDDGTGSGTYAAGPGYDLATGWGSLNAFQLARALNWEHIWDFNAPTLSFTNPSPDVWYNTDQTVSFSANDPIGTDPAASGVSGLTADWDSIYSDPYRDDTPGDGDSYYAGPDDPNATSGSLDLASAGQGCHTAYVEAWDNVGYASGIQSPGTFCYDKSTPSASLTIDGGAGATTSTNASLAISATNPTSGDSITDMRFSTDGTNYGSWQSYGSSSSITLPAGNGTKTVYVEVENEAGTVSAPASTSIQLVPALITSISPTSGPVVGGTTVTINGSGFTGATKVVFGTVAATSFTVVSSTKITAVSPAQAAATHNIYVTVPGGTSPAVPADDFTYAPVPAITSISPTSGPVAGGTTVTINGSGFTGATKVVFGTVAATSFTVVSSTKITAVSPAQAAATHNIYVTTPGGTNPAVAADDFTYAPVPAITSISPTSGPVAGGTTVTINGSGFTGATKVVFGTVAATSFTVVSSTKITAVSPAQAAATHNIYVTTPGGTNPAVAADDFTYAPVPAITSISPTKGPVAGGTTVTINGSGFTGATKVVFGTVAATSFTVVSSTKITAVSPAQAAATHNIYVTTPGGTNPAVAADDFTYYVPVPAITSISPTSGPVAGGTTVTINGSGFTGATVVVFGTVGATSFTVVSDTKITAVSPAEAAGEHNIQVTTSGGTSVKVAADEFTFG